MSMYIQIKDGQPFQHPIMGDNFKAAFPQVDINNLPDWAMRFERIEAPVLGPYEIALPSTYEIAENICRDVHHTRPMTAEEKAARIAEVMALDHPETWVFSEEWCEWVPPSGA